MLSFNSSCAVNALQILLRLAHDLHSVWAATFRIKRHLTVTWYMPEHKLYCHIVIALFQLTSALPECKVAAQTELYVMHSFIT